ncbi:MAG: GTP-binding protein [Myxococcota bacterium]
MSDPSNTPQGGAGLGRTKVTILSGFLGAGKTTLLNALLRDTTEPLGVIVNDFGIVNVDAQLVGSRATVEGEVALQNGCICCTIRGDLLDALLSLTRRPSPPSQILIETSGVSDPTSVARTFVDPRVQDYVELAAIVVCVDPTEFMDLPEPEWSLAADQVKVADFVVMTKGDFATPDERLAAGERVRTIAPHARVVESSAQHTPTDLILNLPQLWTSDRLAQTPARSVHVHEVGHDHGHDHDHDHDHDHHGVHAYETWTYQAQQPLSLYALRRALRRLPPLVFRAKGFVHVAEDPGVRVLVQVVGRRAELTTQGPWGEGDARTELVFLGPEGTLVPDELQSLMDGCRAQGVDATEGFMQDMVGYFNRLLSGVPGHGR